MTRSHRRTHRAAVMALAVIVPAGVALALAARPKAPSGSSRIPAFDAHRDEPFAADWQGAVHRDGLTVTVRVGSAPAASFARTSAPRTLEIEARATTGQPELLAYWSDATRQGDLPEGSILLGPVTMQATQRVALPAVAATQAGRLVLYSLAQGRVAASLDLPATQASSGVAR